MHLCRNLLFILLALLSPNMAPGMTPGQQVTESKTKTEAPGRIAWFGRWKDAQAEATRTKRPILFMSAAPQCGGAPGMW